MTECETLGPTPCDEDCAQTTDADFAEKNRAECKRYKEQLERLFPDLPEGCYFKVKAERGHDFGPYREVAFCFNPENETHWEMFDKIQSGLPSRWE